MQIHFVPVRSDARLDYAFDGELVIVTCAYQDEEATETFDFSSLPNGVAEEIGAGVLPIAPILSATREGGELTLQLRLTRERSAPDEVLAPKNPYTIEGAERLLAGRNAYVPPPIDQGFGGEGDDD